MQTKVVDISSWERLIFNTEGTRDKLIVQSPEDGKVYYFQTSLKRARREYPLEFWSEVIAYRTAHLLGFDALRYDVAYSKTDNASWLVGCISPSMIKDGFYLHSGYNLICDYRPDFGENKNYKKGHTLPLIISVLKHHGLLGCKHRFIECLVLDAIIGNTDRHSENWAMLSLSIYQEYKKSEKELYHYIKNSLVWRVLTNLYCLLRHKKTIKGMRKEATSKAMCLAPIYDSGSSLGREYTDLELQEMLEEKGREKFTRFIEKGYPDIQVVPTKRLTFLECIQLLCIDHPEDMRQIYEQNLKNLSYEEIKEMLQTVDLPARGIIPEELCLSNIRKEFLYNLIYERTERIKSIIQKHVPLS